MIWRGILTRRDRESWSKDKVSSRKYGFREGFWKRELDTLEFQLKENVVPKPGSGSFLLLWYFSSWSSSFASVTFICCSWSNVSSGLQLNQQNTISFTWTFAAKLIAVQIYVLKVEDIMEIVETAAFNKSLKLNHQIKKQVQKYY